LIFVAGPIGIGAERQSAEPPRVAWLTEQTSRLVDGCRTKASGGRTLYCPDGKAHYGALWTRDFAYIVENCPELIPIDHLGSCIRYLLEGQRSDGCVPDRREPDGLSVYSAGGVGQHFAEPPLDNTAFMVLLVCDYVERLGKPEAIGEFTAALQRAMDYTPRNDGLVWNDPQKPHSTFGFTDTVGKTGDQFFDSLLYWQACRRLVPLLRRIGDSEKADEFAERCRLIEQNIGRLWDEERGMFWAAGRDCRQVDVWGNAYAVYIDFPLCEKRGRILNFLSENYDRYVWQGQVRHLVEGEYWERLLVDVERERYQNGAYWATASGWVLYALAQTRPDLARRMFSDLIADFKQRGIYECVNRGYRQLETYVASATNPLGAVRRLARNGFNIDEGQ
jgi:hypothetical protein